MDEHGRSQQRRIPWNKGKLIGQKAPLKLKLTRSRAFGNSRVVLHYDSV